MDKHTDERDMRSRLWTLPGTHLAVEVREAEAMRLPPWCVELLMQRHQVGDAHATMLLIRSHVYLVWESYRRIRHRQPHMLTVLYLRLAMMILGRPGKRAIKPVVASDAYDLWKKIVSRLKFGAKATHREELGLGRTMRGNWERLQVSPDKLASKHERITWAALMLPTLDDLEEWGRHARTRCERRLVNDLGRALRGEDAQEVFRGQRPGQLAKLLAKIKQRSEILCRISLPFASP